MKLENLKAKQLMRFGAGLHADGGNLYLQVKERPAENGKDEPAVSRSWLFRYKPRGQGLTTSKAMGLGALDPKYPAGSLALARQLAADARRLLSAGVDPREKRDAERTKEAATGAAARRRTVTFLDYAKRYVEAHERT